MCKGFLRNRIHSRIGTEDQAGCIRFLVRSLFGAETRFQSTRMHMDAGQSGEEACHTAKEIQKDEV